MAQVFLRGIDRVIDLEGAAAFAQRAGNCDVTFEIAGVSIGGVSVNAVTAPGVSVYTVALARLTADVPAICRRSSYISVRKNRMLMKTVWTRK